MGVWAGFNLGVTTQHDSLDDLQKKLGEVLGGLPGEDILFACDLTGGSPFRTAAMMCMEHPRWAVVAGVNTSAYSEMSFNLELPPAELAKLACDVARETIMMFPAQE